MALRVQGIATPEGADFTVYNPAPQGLKLPALRAEVAEPGRLRPRLFLLLFFTPALRLVLASAAPAFLPKAGQTRPGSLLGAGTPTQPFKRPHSGSQGQAAGIPAAAAFFFVLRVSF